MAGNGIDAGRCGFNVLVELSSRGGTEQKAEHRLHLSCVLSDASSLPWVPPSCCTWSCAW